MREPQVVRTPRVQRLSLCAIGTQASAPPPPPARARSAARAASSAAGAVTVMNALSAPWLRSIRLRHSPTSSTLEKRRARSPAASCVSELRYRSLTSLLDHLGHEVQPAGGLRRVRLVLLVMVLLGDQVRAQPLRQPGEWMRHGSDVGGVARVQSADELDDPRQALQIDRDFGGAEIEARQGRDARELLACEAHGSCGCA